MALIAKDRDIAPDTTMGLHATVAEFIEVASVAELEMLRRQGVLRDAVAIGGGSNMLFTAARFDGQLLHSAMKVIDVVPDDSGARVTAGSGVTLDDLVALSCRWGLWGLENLSLIPGEVGGAAVQNVGAYGAELADTVVSVDVYDLRSGQTVTIPNADMHFSYRHSVMKEPGHAGRSFITAVTFRLDKSPAPRLGYKALAEAVAGMPRLTPQTMRDAVIAMRESKLPDPKSTGSVGSYFKNPVLDSGDGEKFMSMHPGAPAFIQPDGTVKLSAAWLIDHAGCKPLSCGGASLWPRQPLVLVNRDGSATAADILDLEGQVVARVQATFGVTLQCEVVKI